MSEEDSIEPQVADLWRAVMNLSLPATEQVSYLDSLEGKELVDELAIELDDSFWIVGEAFKRNAMSRDTVAALTKLNEALNVLSGYQNEDKWTTTALLHDEAWSNIRRLAVEALSSGRPGFT